MSTDNADHTKEWQPEAEGGVPALLSPDQERQLQTMFGGVAGPQLHNFVGDARTIWGQITKATGPEAISWDQLKGEAFPIQNFYVHGVRLRNHATGKYDAAIRTVLIAPDGRMVYAVSAGVAKDLAAIINTFGMGPYVDPIEVHFTDVKTRSNFKVLRLMPA